MKKHPVGPEVAPSANASKRQNQGRKSDHIRINLEEDVAYKGVSTGLEQYRFVHNALPEVNLEDVDVAVDLLGKRLSAPLLISAMTGGAPEAKELNRRLARAAQSAGIAMGVGSQRAAIEDPDLADSYRVRDVAPDVLLLANLGAIQLNYGYGPEECQRAVDMIGADALVLHLNSMQEALQPEGQTQFAGLLRQIKAVCRALGVPVVLKEVGFGISEDVARRLAGAGVAAIDVAGAGGSSWSRVEMHRATSTQQREAAAVFADWGIPTAASLVMAKSAAPRLPIIASGGIRSGLDVAKAIALGAAACGIAGPLLRAGSESDEAVSDLVAGLVLQLRVALLGVGAGDLDALRNIPLQRCAAQ